MAKANQVKAGDVVVSVTGKQNPGVRVVFDGGVEQVRGDSELITQHLGVF